MPRGPVIVALGLVGGWVTYGYVAGISALADRRRRRRRRRAQRRIVTPLIVLEDAAELGSWVVDRRDLVLVDLGDGLHLEHDLEWWAQQGRLNASLDRVEARPASVIAGMGVGRP